MKLDKQVVDMFTELTKPADDVKMEKTCYGTISVVDGTRYVKLDGSDLLVPAASTVKTSHGDRVTVLMKNHSLTVTGNLTAPATDGEGGSSGEAGTAATIEVGTVTTGEAGSSASVTNSGTTSAAVFDFIIPRGDKGEKGDTGLQGPQGEKGDTGTWDGTIPDHEHTVSDITDFPTSLPASGGDADTLDGKHHYDFVNYLGSITDVDNILNNPEYSDCPYEGVISSDVATSIGLSSAIATEWSIKCFRGTEGSGFQIAVPLYYGGEYPKYRIAVKNHLGGSSYILAWGNWKNFSDDGNADTVDGLHASSFVQWLGYYSSGSILTIAAELNKSGAIYCSRNVTDLPESNKYFFVNILNSDGTIQLTATGFNTGKTYTNRYDTVSKTWYGWANVADGGNADTVDGLHANEIASNPNLLDNPNFKINQRGITSVAGGNYRVYFADRWHSVGCSVTNTDGVVSAAWDGSYIYDDGTNTGYIQSVSELPELIGKQVTLSVNIDDVRHHAVFTIPTTFPGIVRKTVIEDIDIAVGNYMNVGIAAILFFKSTTSHTIGDVKLETGGVATPFCPPDPATELAKCQRYLTVYRGNTVRILGGVAISESYQNIYMQTPVSMRVVPSVSYSNMVLALDRDGNTISNISSVAIACSYATSTNHIKIRCLVDANNKLTIGETYVLINPRGTVGSFILSAEL